MEWLLDADYRLFRLINEGLAGRVGDLIIPPFSGNSFFFPIVGVLLIYLLIRGGIRGRSYVLTLLLSVALGELVLTKTFKDIVKRPRPFVTHPETRVLPGKTDNWSMPSGHSALWGAIATVTIMHYRRSWRFMVPLAFGVGFSRCYVGVHYPTDVMTGWAFGTFYGWFGVRLWNWLWGTAGKSLFPIWWRECPALPPPPGAELAVGDIPADPELVQLQWKRLTYILIPLIYLDRLVFIKYSSMELSEDEAYQWLWSKHLALSYYSKPPFIAYAQWLGTSLFGDNELGVRFLSPTLTAIMSFWAARFIATFTDWRTALLTVLIMTATPMLAAGSILITIDPLTVFFWVAAMLAGWRAIQEDSTRWWIFTGLAMGGGFLSKYFSPFQWASFALFFILHPAARSQLRRPGPWLALCINLVCILPVVIWNAGQHWVTLVHLKERGGLSEPWHLRYNFFTDFVLAEFGLLNPFFFVAAVWACIRVWQRGGLARSPLALPETAVTRYLFSQGAPVFLFYLFYTIRARVQPNWICASVVPLFLLGIIYWHRRWQEGFLAPKVILTLGLSIGLPVVIITHNTGLVSKLVHKDIPVRFDPTHRVRGYKEMANVVSKERSKLAAFGKPVFIIANHYGLAGLMSFYMAEARDHVARDPVVTVISSDKPQDQFWFWPEYRYDNRTGQNALFIESVDQGRTAPDRLRAEFEKVEDLGQFDVPFRGRIYHRLEIFACYNRLAAPSPVNR